MVTIVLWVVGITAVTALLLVLIRRGGNRSGVRWSGSNGSTGSAWYGVSGFEGGGSSFGGDGGGCGDGGGGGC